MELMTMAAVCATLPVSRRTVYRMIRDGVLPAPKKIGAFRQSHFVRLEFERACRKQMRRAGAVELLRAFRGPLLRPKLRPGCEERGFRPLRPEHKSAPCYTR